MKNFAAKLVLVVMAVTGISAAAMATTTTATNKNVADQFTSQAFSQAIISTNGETVVNTLFGGGDGNQMNCYMEWTDARGNKRRLRIQCPKWQK